MTGFTENYIKVETEYKSGFDNQLKTVKLNSVLPNGNVAIDIL